MSEERNTPGGTDNPLAGVLDRLLARERGYPDEPSVSERSTAEPDDTPQPEIAGPPGPDLPVQRRMLTIAGPGTGLGDSALHSAAQWAALLGRRPAITDLCCGDARPRSLDVDPAEPPEGSRIPRARVPCELDRVRREPAEVVLALLDRLRRHELASDLSLVRIPIRQRRTLMRAAFLSGALVLPVEESEREFRETVEVAREVAESFIEISIWPFARSPRSLERFLAAVPQDVRSRATPFDPGRLDLNAGLDALRDPPGEGFLIGLLAPEPAVLPPDLLQVDFLQL